MATKSPNTQSPQATPASAADAVALLKKDHRTVEGLFEQYEKAQSDDDKSKLARQICNELIIHTMLEEEIFYPACRAKQVQDDLLDEAQVEHDGAKVLIAELLTQSTQSEFYDAKVSVLSEYIKHHVREEEQGDGIFAKAKKAGVDMGALGTSIQSRKQELTQQAEATGFDPPKPRSLEFNRESAQSFKEQSNMARNNEQDRDDYGRFSRDDDRDDYRRGDDRNQGGRSFSGRDRDEQGRFMSDDDYGGRSGGRGGGRYGRDEDDESSSRGRGQGGWFGDSRGHSEAARQGWDDRGSSRSSGRDYEDRDRGGGRGYSGRNDDDDYSSRGRSQGGWFGDSRGHSEAAREGREDRGSSRAVRGDYGDYEDRDRSQRGYSSRSERDEDDRGGSRGGSRGGGSRGESSRGGSDHRGWFGDSRGHAEAARRGWQNRD